jgi:hypothetical protein
MFFFSSSFLSAWIHIRISNAYPAPQAQLNPDPNHDSNTGKKQIYSLFSKGSAAVYLEVAA